MNDPRFRILFVCTANLCRSQLAEMRFREYLPVNSIVDVASAGTRAVEGTRIPDRFTAVFDQRRVGALAASQLTATLLADADLVLTMTRAHRSDVVQVLPRCVAYSYTLTQFVDAAEAALADDPGLGEAVAGASNPRALIEAIRSRRSVRAGRAAGDIPDPAHGGSRQLRKVESAISGQVERLAVAFQVRALVEQTRPAPAQSRSLIRRTALDAAS